jgi:hypothetical protein
VTKELVTFLQEQALAYCVVAHPAVTYAGEDPTSVVILYVTAGVLSCRGIFALDSSGSLGSVVKGGDSSV